MIKIEVEHAKASNRPGNNFISIEIYNKSADESAIAMTNLLKVINPICYKHHSNNGKITIEVVFNYQNHNLYHYERFCCEDYCNIVRAILQLPI